MLPIDLRKDLKSAREYARGAVVSVALLAPCFWQSRIQAGDLSSHIYNAWLAQEVHRGTVPGLWIARQHTNIAFDFLLSWSLPRLGVGLTQRAAVSLCVLVFCWGAFAFMRAVAGRPPWDFMVCIALLAYGFVFHLGLFNFYFSAGMCFWFLAATWNTSGMRASYALPLLVVAWLGHPLPVVWAVCAFAYQKLARTVPSRKLVLLIGSTLGLFVLRTVLVYRYPTMRSSASLLMVTGADQVLLYGGRYALVVVLLLVAWLIASIDVAARSNSCWRGILAESLTHVWVLSGAGLMMLPKSILFDPSKAPLTFLPERMSLLCGILLCALLAKVPAPRLARVAMLLAAASFCWFLHGDDQRLNRMEDEIAAAAQTVSTMARVVFVPHSTPFRLLAPEHMIDRACIGHCLSYGSYEPGSGHFRLRASPGSPTAMADFWKLQDLQEGNYVVQSQDLPLYQLVPAGPFSGRYKAVQLREGDRVGRTDIER